MIDFTIRRYFELKIKYTSADVDEFNVIKTFEISTELSNSLTKCCISSSFADAGFIVVVELLVSSEPRISIIDSTILLQKARPLQIRKSATIAKSISVTLRSRVEFVNLILKISFVGLNVLKKYCYIFIVSFKKFIIISFLSKNHFLMLNNFRMHLYVIILSF